MLPDILPNLRTPVEFMKQPDMIVPLTFSPPADSAPCDLLFNSVFHDRSTQ